MVKIKVEGISFPRVPRGAGVALVGGAVRDLMLGRTPKDRDFVVWGASAEAFQAVNPSAVRVGTGEPGKAIPVFLVNGSEVALARAERKTGEGHRDFEFLADPSVTLEEDLARRDLTINAMAVLPDGMLVDPFGGEEDLELGILRHVSPAFAEDPLRVFRLARFASTLCFVPAHATVVIARGMRDALRTVPGERIVGELRKAIMGVYPSSFFRVLSLCGALDMIHPRMWNTLFGIATSPFIVSAVGHLQNEAERFASMCSGLTGAEIMEMNNRLPLPNELRQAALHVAGWGAARSGSGEDQVKALMAAARGPLGVDGLLRVCVEFAGDEKIRQRVQEVVAVKPDMSLKGAAIGADMLRRRVAIWERPE